MKKVAIVQSNYIPWKGYFDLIASVDEFIVFDDAQFTKNDWRNRNKIKTPQGLQWLTVPVGQAISRRIRDVTLDAGWQERHWKTLRANYGRAAHFAAIAAWLAPVYLEETHKSLSSLNRRLIEAICSFLDIGTRLSDSWDYVLADGKSERLVSLCVQAGASQYVSGPAAKDYLQTDAFSVHGIEVEWFDYSGYPEYPQLWGRFEHQVSILDLLFVCGKDTRRHMKLGAS
jgi:hypothetical protein